MKTKNKKFSVIILALVAIVLALSLVLSACNGLLPTDQNDEGTEENTDPTVDPGEKTDDPTDNPTGGDDEETAVLRVTFDENGTYELTDTAGFTGSLNVEIVVGDNSRRVEDFNIKNAKISEDGCYIEVVVEAEGMEKTIRIPYTAEVPQETEYGIRAELVPLYELIRQEGDKGFALTLSGEFIADEESDPSTFTLKAILNLLLAEEEGVQFALVNDSDEALVLFKDNSLFIGNAVVDVTRIMQILSDYTGAELVAKPDADIAVTALAAGDDAVIEEEIDEDVGTVGSLPSEDDIAYEEDELLSFFLDLSDGLDALDEVVGNSIVAAMGISLTKVNDTYSLDVNTQTLLNLLKTYYQPDEDDFDIYQIIDYVDEQLDGALKNGDVKIGLSIGIKNDGVSAIAQIRNDKTGTVGTISALLSVSNEAYELPEVTDAQPYDIEITVPFALPQNDVNALLTATIHTSDMFAEAGKDYVTSTLDLAIGDKEVSAQFVLNDYYAYLDLGALGATFYDTFDIDGDPASILELLLMDIFDGDAGNEPYSPDEPYEPYEPYEENRIVGWGYSAILTDSEIDLALPIGSTEQEFRDRIIVTVTYSLDEEDTIVSDYEVLDFDSSASFDGNVTISLGDHRYIFVPVVIYDPENVSLSYVYVDNTLYLPLNETAENARADISIVCKYTDGEVFWATLTKEGFELKSITGPTPNDYTEEDLDSFVFATAGDYVIGLSYLENTCRANVHIYDPENLIPVELGYENAVELPQDYEYDMIQGQLVIYVIYDDGSISYINDYQYGEPSYDEDEDLYYITVYWDNDLTVFVPVCFIDDEPYDPDYPEYPVEDDFDIMEVIKYLRFVDIDNDGDIAASIIASIDTLEAFYEENKEMLDSIVTITENDDGASIHVVINTEDGEDLLAFLNVFIGIPTADGWVDIDEDFIYNAIEEIDEANDTTIVDGFERVTGVALQAFLSELYFDGNISFEDGIMITIELNGGAECAYVSTGLGIRLVESGEQFVLPDDLSNAMSFENLPSMFVAD